MCLGVRGRQGVGLYIKYIRYCCGSRSWGLCVGGAMHSEAFYGSLLSALSEGSSGYRQFVVCCCCCCICGTSAVAGSAVIARLCSCVLLSSG